MRDAWIKGRVLPPTGAKPLRGEKSPRAKLTWAKVEQMREDANYMSRRDLATKYDISKTQVIRIVRGERWKPNP